MRISYAAKVWISIALLSIGTSVTTVSYLYMRSKALVLEQMGARLADVGRTAVGYFGRKEVERITRLAAEGEKHSVPLSLVTQGMAPGEYRESVPPEQAQEAMESEDFQETVRLLRKIKANTAALVTAEGEANARPAIRYASILTRSPAEEEQRIMRFLADADYDDVKVPNPFGNLLFGNSDALLSALNGRVSADSDFRSEDGQYLLSAGIPIVDEAGTVVAILALDYDAHGEANSVRQLLYWSWVIVVTTLVLSVLLAMIISRMLNRPIEALRAGAERVRQKDFATRVTVHSNDELGLLGSAFNSMVEEIQRYSLQMEAVNRSLERFVPQEFLTHLGRENITDVQLGDNVQRQMTVLFSDIRSFSTITEHMSPRDSFDFVNDYLRMVSPAIRNHGGFIDKFIGDAIMALFPTGPDAAVQCAVEMRRALADFNKVATEQGRAQVKIGIGIHHGNLMLGTVGESARMEGTVISDAVNLASRLESLTKDYHSGIIVSERVAEAIAANEHLFTRYLGTVHVKGKQTAVEIFEVIPNENNNPTRIKIVSVELFERAVRALESRQLSEARALLQEIVEQNPEDETAQVMLERCRTVPETASR